MSNGTDDKHTTFLNSLISPLIILSIAGGFGIAWSQSAQNATVLGEINQLKIRADEQKVANERRSGKIDTLTDKVGTMSNQLDLLTYRVNTLITSDDGPLNSPAPMVRNGQQPPYKPR